MDKKTFIQFLMISMIVMGLWSLIMRIYYPRRQVEPAVQREVAEQADESKPAYQAGVPAPPGEPGVAEIAPTAEQPPPPEKSGIPLSNDLIATSWTNRGAALEQVQLLRYKAPYHEEQDGQKRLPVLTLVKEFQEGYPSDVIEGVTFTRGPGHQEKDWSQDVSTTAIVYEYKEEESSESNIVFEGNLHPWLKVRKTISVDPGAYNFDVELEFTNLTDSDLEFSYRVRGAAGIERETLQNRSIATAVGWSKQGKDKASHLAAAKIVKIEDQAENADQRGDPQKRDDELEALRNKSTSIRWAGTVSQYFVVLTKPGHHDRIESVESRSIVDTDMLEGRGRWQFGTIPPKQERVRAQLARSNACAVIHYKAVKLAPRGTASRTYKFVSAPKLDKVLERYGDGMTKAIRFGVFPSVSRLLLAILKFFHWIIPNYGIAILLLTLVVKIVLHPLLRKSQVSMHKMQQLSPKLQELRKQFGNDRQRMGQEQMALFKKYGVHPMSGCFPMLLQLPVFLALFGTLRSAVELRQAMFIPGWITDLSRPDTIFHLPFYLPILQWNEVNVLPFLMLVSWLMNQKFTPKSTDPQAQQQQKMMQWMPVVFTFMLYRMASGLLLYWTASSAFGILEQWHIRRSLAGVKLRPVAEEKARTKRAKRAPAVPNRAGFFGRIGQALEEHSKKSKQARSAKPKKRG